MGRSTNLRAVGFPEDRAQIEIGDAEDGLVQIRRLLAPDWILAAAASRPTFEDCEPFEL
jgi:hypothetical protein